ncbi:hypothetical protein [Streptomyces bicolor]|uniref:hypothetical protein n=1 Tax=Streptomyces bicolor TaxID=66874 RepID=UPI00131D8F7A|nr:hypothetical protein [Streptomyces bicolor]
MRPGRQNYAPGNSAGAFTDFTTSYGDRESLSMYDAIMTARFCAGVDCFASVYA